MARILVVDDEEVFFLLFTACFRGYRIQGRLKVDLVTDYAPTPQEAIRLVDENEYDLITVDGKLGCQIDGVDLIAHMRRSGVTTKILFMSGTDDNFVAATSVGADATLLKMALTLSNPVLRQELDRALERLGIL